jgi:PAS domain S-box-containing protein
MNLEHEFGGENAATFMTSGNPESTARDARLYRLLESTSDGICEVDADGLCTYCNARGARLLGFEASELQGTFLHDVIHPGGEFLASSECSICQAIKNAQGFKIGDLVRRTHGVLSHRDHRAIPVSYSVAQIVVDGILRGAVMTFYDDSEHRRLAGELSERTAELAESERRKTEFIAILAHELRNPLAPLRAAVQAMRKASHSATSMDQLREIMERQLSQLVRLVNDLLDIARVSSGQLDLQKTRIALQEILNVAIEASASQTISTHSLKLEIPVPPIYVQADATRLTQVFTNILNNAAQYSPADSPVTVRVELDAHHVRIDIADVGVGIARDALNRIFEMFTRVGREAKNTHTGLGIGLNLARRLVEMHDGQLVAMSEGLGKGSRFVITLPLAESQEDESAAENPAEPARSRPIRALIVDDNVDAAASLSLLLQLAGHAICTAHNGADALKLAPEFKPDVVILDIGMPGMNGYEVARALRASPEVGHPVLVALTGWGGPEDRRQSKAAGFDEHLTKPVDISMVELVFATVAARYPNYDGSPPVANGDTIDSSI